MKNKIEIIDSSPNSIEINIYCKRISIPAFLILFFLIILSVLGFGLTIIFSEGEKILIIPLLFYAAGSVYFVRLLLWNSMGKEVYKITKGKINYYYDYGWFKDTKTEEEFNILTFGILDSLNDEVYFSFDNLNSKSTEGVLLISLDESDIESMISQKITDLIQKINEIESSVNNFLG